jgi:hypothetical protein
MPGVAGVTVVTTLVCFYFTHEAAGASRARHSLRPLVSEGGTFLAKLGRIAPRECEGVSFRHCFVASLLAMTVSAI